MSVANEFLAVFIDGVPGRGHSDAPLENRNPSTGEVIGHFYPANEADVDQAVLAAHAAFEDRRWRALSPAHRSRAMHRLADLIEEHGDELAALEMQEAGKLKAAARQGEVPFAAECFRYHAGWCSKLEGRTTPMTMAAQGEFHTYTVHDAIGVAGLITPYNGALVQASWKLAPALAAGCTVVIKPDEKTPMSTLRLAELAVAAGIPPGVVNVVVGSGQSAGAALVRHPLVRKISFTGSTKTGKEIGRTAMDDLKKVTLELGGKSPIIVLDDADLDAAIHGVADAIFSNAGQVCVAGSRLYAESRIYDELVAGVAELSRQLKVGRADDGDTDVGPLISERHRDNVLAAITGGEFDGAKILTGGKRIDLDGGYFVEPTVIVDADSTMSVLREEIFGPVLVATKANDMQQCVRESNNSRYGLAASIWTRDIAKAHRLANEVQAGIVWVNCHGIPDMAVPFGGYKQSGWGRENGLEGLLAYTELKSVICKL
ncbi:MAG TPA: aldehyde dehydrogenase family protein [Woeseiaceae bacterium]|nr:aldehyde dehydrogenase family protein [Woeseiaceae bacterium]